MELNTNSIISKSIETDKDVFVENQSIKEEIDFTVIKKPNLVGANHFQSIVKSTLVFKNCSFSKKIKGFREDANGTLYTTSFTNPIVFLNCTFNEEVDLRSCNFLNKVNFTGSHFLKKVSFENIKVVLDAVFANVIFDNESFFQNSHFYDHVNFFDAQSKMQINFQGMLCGRDLNCNNMKTYGYVDFSLLKVIGEALFNYTEFNDKIYVSNAIFIGKTFFNNNKIKFGTIKNCVFHHTLLFDKASITDEVSISNNTFLVPHAIKEIKFLKFQN